MKYIFSTLNRYFSSIFLTWTVSCCLIIGAVISLFEGTELARRAMGKSQVTMPVIIEMILLKLPNHLQTLMPFIVLMASMITLWRLNSRQELVSARSTGLSIWQILGGLSAAVCIVGFFQLFILNPLSSVMLSRFSNLEGEFLTGKTNRLSVSETGLWLKEVTDQKQSIIHAAHLNTAEHSFSKITFYNFNKNDLYESRIHAEKAFLKDNQWVLSSATTWTGGDGAADFKETLALPTELSIEKIQESNADPKTISFWKLSEFIDILDKSGLSSKPYRLHWHSQLAKIGMMITMLLLAASFSLRPIRQGGTFLLIAFGITGGFLLHFLSDIVYALGLADKIPLVLAAWAPTLIMGLLSTSMLLHLEDG